jgi:hypothetical protein
MKSAWLIALAAALLGPASSRAQPLFGAAESIESTVLNAELVVVGKVIEIDGKGTTAVAVETTLKGKHRDRLSVSLSQPAKTVTAWRDRSSRLLIAARGESLVAVEVIDLADNDLHVLAADFTLLRKPADVIRAAGEAVRRMPGVTRIETFRFPVPAEAAAGTAWEKYYGTGGYVTLAVPVDERLEKRALEATRSDNPSRREEAARALRYFKSEANVARVRALLTDPAWSVAGRAEDKKGVESRFFRVREAAFDTLKYWGVKVDKPQTREELWKPEKVQTVSLANTKLTDAELRGLDRFKNLEALFLWNTEMTDTRLKELAGLANLRDLYLGGTKVTDAGLKELAGLARLKYLDLASTKVTDEGLKTLADFKGLKKLSLNGAHVTDDGVAELKKQRPDVTVER